MADRMHGAKTRVYNRAYSLGAVHGRAMAHEWPFPNVWLGVSVEDQQRADERIPLLLQTPASVRFVSVEPMLGYMLLSRYLNDGPIQRGKGLSGREAGTESLDWVIIGGESGPNARPFNVAAGRALMEQCQAAGVPTWWKQFGALPVTDGSPFARFKDRAGADPAEWPEWARVQQMPEVMR